MTKIAIVDKQPGHINYIKYMGLEHLSEDITILHLSTSSKKKILKIDVDISINIDDYDYIILIGSEACKFIGKITSVTNYAGQLIEDKFIPMINPAMLAFKPEATRSFEDACVKCRGYLEGTLRSSFDGDFVGIQDYEQAKAYLEYLRDHNTIPVVAIDTETSNLYPREGYLLGVSMSHKLNQGVYIDADLIDENLIALIQQILDTKEIVMHNAKFDIKWMEYHLGLKFGSNVHDTMLLHYILDETTGSHGLKILAMKYTNYGDYDKELEEFKKTYCRAHKILQKDFSYAFIPFEIMYPYACMDTGVTIELFQKFYPLVEKSKEFSFVYTKLLQRGMRFLNKIEENGVPINIERVKRGIVLMSEAIEISKAKLYEFSSVLELEEDQQVPFNPNSTLQLRRLLFDYEGLTPTGKKTGTGANSTDSEVLTELSKFSALPKLILEIRGKTKVKNTYLDKIAISLDNDQKLRTGYNLTMTTSGRLSSSGKLNMQQIIRDDPIVKGCIQAPPGYKIISQDLGTAEMYYAAVLSQDKKLMSIFQEGGDFHSSIAKMVFKLTCSIADVKKFFGPRRQAAKAISFGILYGSGATKVSDTVTDSNKADALKAGVEDYDIFSPGQAQNSIDEYYKTYGTLKQWLDKSKDFILANGFIFSAFGRKRRLQNAFSSSRSIVGETVRSGVNFLIQSIASDINLLAAMDMQDYIEETELDAEIFGLVHDSILSLVKDECIEEYCEALKVFTQQDRGLSIPGTPISVDVEIGQDYSFGKFEKAYPDLAAAA